MPIKPRYPSQRNPHSGDRGTNSIAAANDPPGDDVGMTSSALDPEARRRAIERMSSEVLDVLVVGGGITGVGAALDAVTRGLSVGLIEARDYAAGTSSKSSKLIHGGLRYLEMLDFGLVRESLRERELLLTRLAPHLVKPVPFLWPLTHRGWERVYLGAGLALYDRIGGARSVPRARHLSHREVRAVAPGLRPEAFVGGVQFYDAQEDDARLVAYVARTAHAHGASLATRVAATGFLREGERVVGVIAHDDENGVELSIRARHVLGATGVWSDELRELAGARSGTRIRPSKGIHIVVPRDRIAMDTGVLMRTEKSVLFIIPWGPHWILGDTDTAWEHDPAHPAATRTDIEYLLEKANGMLSRPLTRDDIEGVFVGLRPLVGSSESADTTRLSRAHTVESPVPGLTTIAGGKYTTYRVMAKDLVDAAVPPAGRRHVRIAFRSWGRRATRPAGTSAAGSPTRPGSTFPGWHACSTATATGWTTSPPSSPSVASSPRRLREPRSTSPSRWSTPARTRARSGSRTCSRGARGSRSRRATAASPRLPRWRR